MTIAGKPGLPPSMPAVASGSTALTGRSLGPVGGVEPAQTFVAAAAAGTFLIAFRGGGGGGAWRGLPFVPPG